MGFRINIGFPPFYITVTSSVENSSSFLLSEEFNVVTAFSCINHIDVISSEEFSCNITSANETYYHVVKPAVITVSREFDVKFFFDTENGCLVTSQENGECSITQGLEFDTNIISD